MILPSGLDLADDHNRI